VRERFADLMEDIGVRKDRDAFTELFEFYAPRVKGYILRLGATIAMAEEITQETMVQVWRKAETFDRKLASVSTWIFRIARNRRIDAARRAAHPGLDPEDPSLQPAPAPAPDFELTNANREERVRAALETLPQEQHDLLRAAFYEGLSHREIADRWNLPLGTVKSRIRLAFQKLKGQLEADF
jgi:RNA polymerase sigma-70 factor, ECF subfamily